MDILLNTLISQAMTSLGSGNIMALASLFLVVILTESGIPFPFVLDSALFFSSYQNGPLSIQTLRVVLAVFLGRQAGAATIYWLARFIGSRSIDWLANRFPWLGSNLTTVQSKLSTRAFLPIATARITSLLTLSSLASGLIRVPFRVFCQGVALSALMFDGSLIVLGFVAQHWFRYLGFSPSPWMIIFGLVVIIIIVYAGLFLFERSKRKKV